jgi:hypothetical protein
MANRAFGFIWPESRAAGSPHKADFRTENVMSTIRSTRTLQRVIESLPTSDVARLFSLIRQAREMSLAE